uniref:Uncharacterized protein LOC117346600 n=1 Tax=Geotrypetes seraphini TaxID=260995 RepID=A0A6P8PBQ1_GEOSA|nr:uncharacterized protein LOC117346600 [Geotrypetes seraphini]XP_033772338.1 uncharacterized protein LOC117346600 [Geotrypetes seraphini]
MKWTFGFLRHRRAACSLLLPVVRRDIWRKIHVTAGGGQQIHTQSPESSRPIGRYPTPNKEDLPQDIVKQMEAAEKEYGFLPNVFKLMSHRPAEFRALFTYYDAIMNRKTERLNKADKELIAVAVSAANKCLYCVTKHSALHRIFSKHPTLADQVIVNWELAELSHQELAMLKFAMAVARAETITEEHFKELEEHGFDQEDAWDIAMVSAFFALANRLAHFTDLRPNKELYSLGRIL